MKGLVLDQPIVFPEWVYYPSPPLGREPMVSLTWTEGDQFHISESMDACLVGPEIIGRTPSSKSPTLMAYIAALNILDAEALLSTGRSAPDSTRRSSLARALSATTCSRVTTLRHSLGIKDTRQINQIANMALVEWCDNIAISDLPPAQYWPEQMGKKRDQLSDDAGSLSGGCSCLGTPSVLRHQICSERCRSLP